MKLADRAGLHLDDWQQWVLTQALGERDDGNWSAFEVGLIVPRQNGKGSILEARELYGLIAVEEERLIVHSAHLFKTAKEAFHRILRLLEGTADLKRKIKKVTWTRGDEGIEMVDGSRLNFVARSKGGGRGLTGDCLILDEAFALTDDHIEALMPIMSARENGQIWYTSSPPLDEATGEVLFGVKARGEAGDPVLAWMDWGQPRDVDPDDRSAWAAANPALGIRINVEAVERERRTMKPEGFARERLGVWPAAAGTQWRVIGEPDWNALVDHRPQMPERIAFGVQIDYRRRCTAIAAAGFRPDGTVLGTLVAYQPGTDWVIKRLVELREKHRPIAIAVQDKGPTGSLIDDMARVEILPPVDKERPGRGDLAVPWADDVADAYGKFVDAVNQDRFLHTDDAPLNLAVADADTRQLSGALAWDYRGKTDCSPLLAMTFAYWALVTRNDLVVDDFEPSAHWL